MRNSDQRNRTRSQTVRSTAQSTSSCALLCVVSLLIRLPTQNILTKGKYYTAIGLVTEAILSRILQDILALSDIPEVDSHRLSELCRILNSLEGLFSEDPAQHSFVVAYVPSWLKFNYLSELLVRFQLDFLEMTCVDFVRIGL